MSEGQQIETDPTQLTFHTLQQDDDWEGALIDEVPQPRLLSSEAQTISSILENCISQTEIAASLPAVHNIVHPSAEICDELTRALEVHQMLTEKLETSNGLQEEPCGSSDEECAKRRRRAQLERDFKYSVRDLLRLFRTHPDAVFGFRSEVDTEIGEAEHTLILGLKHFYGHMIVRLQTSPEEEILLAVETVSPDTDMIVKLEEIAAAIEQKDVEISKKTDDLSILERCLLESQTEEVDWQLVADKQCQSLIKTSQVKQTSIQQEIDKLNIRLHTMTLKYREGEKVLQEINENVEMEMEYLIQKFDDEIEEHQADLELCQMDVEREEGECKRLEKPYADLEKEYNCIMEKRRLAEEKRVTELKLKVTLYCQSWWRGYCTRKELALNPIKPTKKGKKKGKGKGKGKKKKK
nr:dynein regulatory complex protein 10 isoform X2 [Doryrhamphus excisus]XP_057926480.1 dynein regulatory complex protein 10 isoform X2 [Doryrhamphus excisus]XP_057926481.1 dynein regulatory complex protein 10 isoform X2 [Doryrhamphus excisus]XP_057926482.1 dynein regulatory complex protein 10 isoform X2 [Doryrhamphus excisus]